MQEFTKILNMIIDVIEPVGNVTILLALFMFIFAILGVQLFGNEDAVVPYLDEDKRYNFHSFTWALYSTFVMLTGENWPGIMFNAIYGMPGGIGDDCNPDLIQPARMGQTPGELRICPRTGTSKRLLASRQKDQDFGPR